MSNTAIALIAAAVALIAVIILAARGSGPRVTTIETRRDEDEDKTP